MIVVIDYKAGNLYNVGNALEYLKKEFVLSGDPDIVKRAEKVILPGVGSARPAMESLKEQGLVEVLQNLRVPFLGICLGLQLLYEVSREEDTPCLGVLPGTVQRFNETDVKVPHIGWNQVEQLGDRSVTSVLFEAVPDRSFFYFVHSYFAPFAADMAFGKTEYGETFASAVAKDNFWGVQFHPERSGKTGLHVLSNFLEAPSSC